jgi:hypothetical protein
VSKTKTNRRKYESEKTIERKACEAAKRHGMVSIKLGGFRSRGKPDRLFLLNGETMFIEFKSTGCVPTVLQRAWIAKLRSIGYAATFIDSSEEAIASIDAFAKIAKGEI